MAALFVIFELIFHRHHHHGRIPVRIWVYWHIHHKHHHHHNKYREARRFDMPLPPLSVGQKVTGTVFETDAKGVQFAPPPSRVNVASSDDTICTIVNNGDGTVTATAVAPGSATETISDTQFTSVTDQEAVTVADVPVAIGVNWGTPQ